MTNRFKTAFATRLKLLIIATTAIVIGPGLSAAEQEADTSFNQVAVIGVETEVRDQVLSALKQALPDLPVLAVVKTPLPDMVSLELVGGQILYASVDGRFLISGDLYQVSPKLTNLAEQRRELQRRKLMDTVPTNEMVVFSPVGKARTHINVFTDVDCGYCRKLHQEVPALNARGIEVRYLAYPRAGFDTPTYDKIVSAWCSKDRQTAMTTLKNGQMIPQLKCDNPVQAQFAIGQQVGVTGTPAIVTASGQLISGYRPAEDLAAALGIQ